MSIADKLTTIAGNQQKVYDKGYADGAANGGGSGGSSEDVCYVTFMSDDGTTELCKKPVAVGDDCADVIARGLIETPTKESTETVTYTHSGWSLTSGGSADDSALLSVTEDRTVYAAFTESTRYYTVRFFDGETLVDTVSVAYGATALTDYAKDGYSLVAWTPSNENITADTDCYGEWIEAETITDDWATISARSLDGTASEHYSVGDTKKFTLTNSEGVVVTIFAAIAGFNLHRNTDGTKDGITFIVKTVPPSTHLPSDASYDVNSAYDQMSDDVKAVVRQSLINTVNQSGSSSGGYTADDIITTPYLFEPELTNISTSLTTSSGSTSSYMPTTSFLGNVTCTATQATNAYDAGIFPLFKDKSKAEIVSFFGMSSAVDLRTRTQGKYTFTYGSHTFKAVNPVTLVTDDTYTLCKKCERAQTRKFFCFRV